MKQAGIVAFCVIAILVFYTSHAGSELNPLVGMSAFGGAERGNGKGIDGPAGAIGGTEVFGLLPFTKRFGLQGSILNQGGRGAYRLGVSAGPVFDYDSGKVGLFTDYVHQARGSNNFVYLRGVWSHYLKNFDLVLSYSQPVNSVQHTRQTVANTIVGCGVFPKVVNKKAPAINELKVLVRYYPASNVELDGGLLVNSFAGPDRNDTGTGFGGVFGASYQLLDWLVLRLVQGQMDTRERYRITSGVEFIWTPARQEKPSRLRSQNRDEAFAIASSASGTTSAPPGGGCP